MKEPKCITSGAGNGRCFIYDRNRPASGDRPAFRKGLEILSISLDEDRTKLEEFLAKEPLPWKQVFSGNGWNDVLAKKFEVDGTPYSFLVDKNGIMRAFDVRGEDIEKTAARLLNDGDD